MADARRMGKSELFSHFAERFEMKRAQAREFFEALTAPPRRSSSDRESSSRRHGQAGETEPESPHGSEPGDG